MRSRKGPNIFRPSVRVSPTRILGSVSTNESVELYTVPEAAARLRVARSTLFRLLKNGDLKSIKIGAKRFVTASQIADYVDRLERAA